MTQKGLQIELLTFDVKNIGGANILDSKMTSICGKDGNGFTTCNRASLRPEPAVEKFIE